MWLVPDPHGISRIPLYATEEKIRAAACEGQLRCKVGCVVHIWQHGFLEGRGWDMMGLEGILWEDVHLERPLKLRAKESWRRKR